MPKITIAYNQTESSPAITQTRTGDPIERRVSTVGCKLSDVQVYGVPDEKYGEQIAAVTLKGDDSLTGEDVREFWRENIASYSGSHCSWTTSVTLTLERQGVH